MERGKSQTGVFLTKSWHAETNLHLSVRTWVIRDDERLLGDTKALAALINRRKVHIDDESKMVGRSMLRFACELEAADG